MWHYGLVKGNRNLIRKSLILGVFAVSLFGCDQAVTSEKENGRYQIVVAQSNSEAKEKMSEPHAVWILDTKTGEVKFCVSSGVKVLNSEYSIRCATEIDKQ